MPATLEDRYAYLKNWRFRNEFREFADYAGRTSYGPRDDGQGVATVQYELECIENQIQLAVRTNNEGHFNIMEDAYRKLFTDLNHDIATTRLYKRAHELMKLGYVDDEAHKKALQDLMVDPKLAAWIPPRIYKRITARSDHNYV